MDRKSKVVEPGCRGLRFKMDVGGRQWKAMNGVGDHGPRSFKRECGVGR